MVLGKRRLIVKVDMTFARGLRAILRQDPDVVMIGEIRDLENRTYRSTSQFNRSLSIINIAY